MSAVGQRKTKDEVKEALKGIAAEMHNKMEKGVPPAMTLPVRSKTNIGWSWILVDKSFWIFALSLYFANMKWLTGDTKYGLLSSEKVAVTKNNESIFRDLTHRSFNSIERWLCK